MFHTDWRVVVRWALDAGTRLRVDDEIRVHWTAVQMGYEGQRVEKAEGSI